jgi:hypothetical protein
MADLKGTGIHDLSEMRSGSEITHRQFAYLRACYFIGLIEDSIPRKIVLAFGQTIDGMKRVTSSIRFFCFTPALRYQMRVGLVHLHLSRDSKSKLLHSSRGGKTQGRRNRSETTTEEKHLKAMRRPVRGFFEHERRGAGPRDKETDSHTGLQPTQGSSRKQTMRQL